MNSLSKLLFLICFSSFSTLKCPLNSGLSELDEYFLIENCQYLKMFSAQDELKMLVHCTKTIKIVIDKIMEDNVSDLESALSSQSGSDKTVLAMELIRHLGLSSLIDDQPVNQNIFIQARLRLFPVSLLNGFLRIGESDGAKIHALTEYVKLLKKIRTIFSDASTSCKPSGPLKGFLELMLCCCPSLRSGASGALAERLLDCHIPYNCISAIGLSFEFLVKECDRQLHFIFKNYDPDSVGVIYERRSIRDFIKIIAKTYGYHWLIESQ